MAEDATPAIGMSVGATTLVAATAAGVVTRRPVLTLYPRRHSEVGSPSENPHLGTAGVVVAGFVDHVGEKVLAPDGSAHRGADLLADAVHALAYVATGGQPLPAAVTITHPAHWPAAAVEDLRAALGRVEGWPDGVTLVSDAAAALTALRADPGLPERGTVALCDFGGSGTSLTLLDDGLPVGTTVRHRDLSGERVDQALLTHVVADLGAAAVGSLAVLRTRCRSAKELLSTCALAALAIDAPGCSSDITLDRSDLDDVIRGPLDGFLAIVRDRIRVGDLAALAFTGGMSAIPGIATRMSNHLGVPVIGSPRPQTTAGIGALLQAGGSPPGG